MKITKRRLKRIIEEEYQKIFEAKKGQYSMKDIVRDHGPQRSFEDKDGIAYLEREARHSIKRFGDDYKNDDAEDDYYEWGEATGYDLYDLRVAWENVIEQFEAEEEEAGSGVQRRAPVPDG